MCKTLVKKYIQYNDVHLIVLSSISDNSKKKKGLNENHILDRMLKNRRDCGADLVFDWRVFLCRHTIGGKFNFVFAILAKVGILVI